MIDASVFPAFGVNPTGIEPVDLGCTNTLYKIRQGGRSFALKQYRSHNRINLIASLKAQETAGKNGINVPEIIATRNNEWLFEYENHYWSLTSWLKGKSIPWKKLNTDMAFTMGKTLGQIHTALKPLDPSAYPATVQETFFDPGLTKQLIETYRHLINHNPSPDPFAADALEFLDFIEPRIRTYWPLYSFYRSLPHQVVHGDFWELNILFETNSISGILDWEFVFFGPVLFDLSYVFGIYLLNMDDQTKTIELTTALLAGYQTVSPLSAREIQRLPDLYILFIINNIFGLYNHFVRGNVKYDPFIRDYMTQLSAIEDCYMAPDTHFGKCLTPLV